MRGPEEWPSHQSNPADRIRLTGPAAFFSITCSDPCFAASTRPEPDSKLSNPTRDQHYENLRAGTRGLFIELGWQLKIDNSFFIPSDKLILESASFDMTWR